jgi:hypothetical protein
VFVLASTANQTQTRKEVIIVRYAKPELALLADARVAIQSGNGDGGMDTKSTEVLESPSNTIRTENTAYEADE